MKLGNSSAAASSLVFLLRLATSRVHSFVLHPHAIASAAPAKCGAISFARKQHAPSARAAAAGVGPDPSFRSRATRMTTGALPSDGGGISRGEWAGRMLGVAITGAVAVSQGPEFASAEVGVGEGGLPDGARQFSNLVKVQKDWAALGKSIESQGADVTADEWKNVALFLRKVYQLGGELEYLAGTFSLDKKKSALALVRSIQKEVQAADVPAREKDAAAFMKAQASVQKKFEDFMELF
ncbi:unnamed protein product, partial [Ectocarpus sp. 12 AP-2014]